MINRLNINKILITVISINGLQIIILFGYLLYSFISVQSESLDPDNIMLIALVLTTLLNSFYIVKDAKNINQYDLQYEMLKESLSHVEELNRTLKSQRHDFRNHLQVVYSLVEMCEYDEAKSYLERVCNDINKVGRSLKTLNPAINALLQAKTLDCEKKGININLNISSQLKNLKVPAWEMCRVLGNIIDNAIYALEEKESNRFLNIEIYEDLLYHFFVIEDNGPIIPAENVEKIFEPGFTTKEAKGEGMGLSISKNIVASYGGLISVISSDDNTLFTVKIPLPSKQTQKVTS